METLIKYLGLVDHNDTPHGVSFKEGLNIVTGRSSTGKSALIEIFDYCMGATSSTIPKGVITENAAVFFMIIKIGQSQWVLGHSATSKGTFYLQLDNELKNEHEINRSYFNEGNFLNTDSYKKKLGYLFGLTIPNTQEEDNLQYTHRKKGRPSVRNMVSYLLQHQNLVANKLALFYRFDEKEKKDDVIEQFKIFAGFVDAEYYDLSYRISKTRNDLKILAGEAENQEKRIELIGKNVDIVLQEYKNLTDNDLFDIKSSTYVLAHTKLVKEQLQKTTIQDVIVTQKKEDAENIKNYNLLQRRENELHAEIRRKQMEIQDYDASIKYVESYKKELTRASFLEKAEIDYSICPFCKQHTHIIEEEVKELKDSIDRLNKTIKEVPLLNDELYTKKSEAQLELNGLYDELSDVGAQMRKLQDVIRELRKNRSLEEQGYKKMLELEALTDVILEMESSDANQKYLAKKSELEELEQDFKRRYNIEKKMATATSMIEQYLADYRTSLPFEKSLKDYSLKFNLDTFELYFEKEKDKIRLRSIGSGKNWLNAHLCLFMAIAKYFYKNAQSKLPTILFIDQPSQVYFPTNDQEESFDAKQMIENREGKKVDKDDELANQKIEKMVDNDMQEVTNIFNTLYKFTKDLDFGVQVIVTEHADKLNMDDAKFEDLVAARWRKDNEGLIMDRSENDEISNDEQDGSNEEIQSDGEKPSD